MNQLLGPNEGSAGSKALTPRLAAQFAAGTDRLLDWPTTGLNLRTGQSILGPCYY